MCEICSKVTIKTERPPLMSIILFTLLTLNKQIAAESKPLHGKGKIKGGKPVCTGVFEKAENVIWSQ